MASDVRIREARDGDLEAVATLMTTALAPYYGGDHRRHAERIFQTHVSGGQEFDSASSQSSRRCLLRM